MKFLNVRVSLQLAKNARLIKLIVLKPITPLLPHTLFSIFCF